MIKFTTGYCYDDVLLVPKHSSIKSRDDVDLSVQLPKDIKLKIPLLSSNMKSLTDVDMAVAISNLGGLPILHRFDSHKDIVSKFEKVIRNINGFVGCSVGIKDEDKSLISYLYSSGCKIICVDVAHGDHERVCEFVSYLKMWRSDILIIAGNVVTPTGACNLWKSGADIIKLGIGNGSICSTRIETGNGYPQLSVLDNVCNHYYEEHDGYGPIFIADGSVKSAGDCVKALSIADLVMIGNLFAGTDEAPGEVVTLDGKRYKRYDGSSTHKSNYIEGVKGLVPYKGKVSDIVKKITEGIRSGCSYQGANNLKELKLNPEFVVISNAGLKESHPHSVVI